MIETTRRTLESGGLERTYILVAETAFDASNDIRPGRPLIVLFHGTGQSGSRMRRFSGGSFDDLVESAGAVIVYPDGYRKDWNGARDIDTPAQRANVDDVLFFHTLIDELVATHNVDPYRVFVVGFSLGGQMVMRLLHEAPECLAGAGIISSTQPAPEIFVRDHREAGKAVPVILFHGTKDPLTPYDGGVVSVRGFFPRGPHLSAPDTAAYYAARNGHSDPPATEVFRKPDGTNSTSVTTTTYGKHSDAPVVLYTIQGGGHQVPNPRHIPTRWFWGHSSRDLCCAAIIAKLIAPRSH